MKKKLEFEIMPIMVASLLTCMAKPQMVFADDAQCAAILSDFCGEDGMQKLLKFIANMMMYGIIVAGTIGIVICGVMWMTAGDSPERVKKARTRLIEIVIGMALAVLLHAIITMLLGHDVNLEG